MAVAIAESAAEVAPFQRSLANIPPAQNVNSATSRELAACHFGGKYAEYANAANFVQITK